MSIISIQSQVMYGHVGNSIAVFPQQYAGFEVVSVPTVLLSNHPAYPSVYGAVMAPELVANLLRGIEERGTVEAAQIIVTGYIGSPEIAALAADFVRRAKLRNPYLVYLCDPVMGDIKPGYYVPPEVRGAITELLMPLADIISPNRFEFDALTQSAHTRREDIVVAARALGKDLVLITGSPNDDETLDTFAVTADSAWHVTSPRLVTKASGTGDLLSSLFVAARLKGKSIPLALADAVSGIHAILEVTVAADAQELDIIRHAQLLYPAAPRFTAKAI